MTLAEHLAQTGVSLQREVGFIVQEAKTEHWQTKHANRARVITDLPEMMQDDPVALFYDPEYDLALVHEKKSEQYLYVLSITQGGIVYGLHHGGLIILNAEGRILIGQSEDFMQTVCELQCALAAPLH